MLIEFENKYFLKKKQFRNLVTSFEYDAGLINRLSR